MSRLRTLYGSDTAQTLIERIMEVINQHRATPKHPPLDASDVMLIAYADHVRDDGVPLKSLEAFAAECLSEMISGIHILPFYESTSDGGFAVSDYDNVNPDFGDWTHISQIASRFRLMADCVMNHCSSKHRWFTEYLSGNPEYQDYFIEFDPNFDTSLVVRPRSSQLFSEFASHDGTKKIWTTFGPDQIDLNYRSPSLLLEIIEIVANYISKGASLLRFDATHFVWKESGTSCVNLPQTHEIIKLLRDVIDAIDPSVVIVNETNIPHAENVTYFGDGHDEAQLVYNFALPSLVAHTIISGSSEVLVRWATKLEVPSEETGFFNYSAVHDGISLRGSSQILHADQLQTLVHTAVERDAQILYRSTPHGDAPYELCVTYFDLLADPADPLNRNIDRFILAQAIVLSLAGVPAMYFSNLIGAQTLSPTSGPDSHPRDVIREKYSAQALAQSLRDNSSRSGKVFTRMKALLQTRRTEPAFHPNGSQRILDLSPGLVGIERTSVDGSRTITAIFNVTPDPHSIKSAGVDILSGKKFDTDSELGAYGFAWLV